jgi:Zn-dependent peptidase ImmA (M78 family)
MTRFAYYEEMKQRAREVRAEFGFTTPHVQLSDLRQVYKKYRVRIDLREGKFRNLRGAYFLDEGGASVMIAKKLPKEQRIFTMGHELKHHLVDAEETRCMNLNANDEVEIGAEIFAAELIFPEADFSRTLQDMGVRLRECTPEHIVRLKHNTNATLSFTSLGKLAVHLGFADHGVFDRVHWKKLDEQIHGVPLYKRLLQRRGLAVR